jgi:hypothetical protein
MLKLAASFVNWQAPIECGGVADQRNVCAPLYLTISPLTISQWGRTRRI